MAKDSWRLHPEVCAMLREKRVAASNRLRELLWTELASDGSYAQVDLELRLLEDWQRKEMEKAALVAWVLGKEEREEEEQMLNIEVMEVLELEKREKERHIAVGQQLV